jgi:hypothetical protein
VQASAGVFEDIQVWVDTEALDAAEAVVDDKPVEVQKFDPNDLHCYVEQTFHLRRVHGLVSVTFDDMS